MTPQRVQRRRTAGWRMPAGAIYVGRPTRWGNAFRVLRDVDGLWYVEHDQGLPTPVGVGHSSKHKAAAAAVGLFKRYSMPSPGDLAELAGRDLACWCPLAQPCHADVLLRAAASP